MRHEAGTGLGEWERVVIIERTKPALAHLRADGRPTGPVPFGKKVDSRSHLVAAYVGIRASLRSSRGVWVRGMRLDCRQERSGAQNRRR